MSDTPKFTLHYFDIDGNGQFIRRMCKYAKLPLQDHRFKEGEFAELKESGKLAFGQVPALELHDGTVLVQTGAIMRFLARQAPAKELYPTDPAQAAQVDAVMSQWHDAVMGRSVTRYRGRFGVELTDEEAERHLNKWKSNIFPRHLGYIEALIKEGGTEWITGSDRPTIADFVWGFGLAQLSDCFDASEHPLLANLIESVKAL